MLIKVVPLVLLAWFAWHAASTLGDDVSDKAGKMADATLSTIQAIGKTVTDDSIRALDLRSREAIEALEGARAALKWVDNHRHRNDPHDMSHAKLALDYVLSALESLRDA